MCYRAFCFAGQVIGQVLPLFSLYVLYPFQVDTVQICIQLLNVIKASYFSNTVAFPIILYLNIEVA